MIMNSKSFALYKCNSDGSNAEFIQNVAVTPMECTSMFPAINGVLPQAAAATIDQYTSDRNQVIVNVSNTLDQQYFSVLNACFPGLVYINYGDMTGKKLKLVAGNGYYALQRESGASASEMYDLYDADGVFVDYAFLPFKAAKSGWFMVRLTSGDFVSGERYYVPHASAPVGNQQSMAVATGSYRTLSAAAASWLNQVPAHIVPPDPFTPGDEGDIDGPSGPGGGEGDHDTTSDPIDIPTLPTTSAVDTGFITLFNPSLTEIRALADYMWNGLFDINNLRKLFADPMDVILGLSIVPGPVPSGAQEAVSIGNISTGVMMTKAADQFFTVDCGTLKPTEFWGAYLDYSPYTKVDIYLPFIGMRSLSIDDVMEKNVNVVYHVDILSGACVAFIKSGDQVLYTHIGQCASSIPINGNDWTNTINGILSMAAAIAGTVATGGAAAPMLMGQAANITNILKPSVARSGGMGGMGGMLGIQKPYLILTRPRQCVPGNQNIYKGYPAFMTRALGDLSGMTSVEDIHLAVAGATQEELEEIERLLKEGVML